MAFITIVNVISEGSLKKLEVDLRFWVCAQQFAIKSRCLYTRKQEKRKFTLFSVYSKRSFYKMFCHMCKSKPTEKLIKLFGKKYFYAYFLFGIFESFYTRCKLLFAMLYFRAELFRKAWKQ